MQPLQIEEVDSSESGTSQYEIEETLDNDKSSAVSEATQDDAHVESEADNRCKPIYEHKEALNSINYLVRYLEEHEIDRKDLKYRLYLKNLTSESARSQQQNHRQAKITLWASTS